MKEPDGLGKLIREARLRRGWTQEDLGRHLGTEKSYVSAIETNARKWPQEYIGPLARLLGLAQVEMAIAAGLIEREADRPPLRLVDDRLRTLAAHWETLTALEQDFVMVVLDRHLLREGEPGVDNLVRSVGYLKDAATG